MEGETDRPLGEVLLVFAAVTAATAGITWLPRALPGMTEYVSLAVGAVFLMVAVRLARRRPGGMQAMGIDLAGLLEPPEADDERAAGPLGLYDLLRAIRAAALPGIREAGVALGVAAVVFPPFVVGFYYWNHPTHPFELRLPEDFAELALTQLLVIALPEEAFFRGYVQTRLGDRWSTKPKWLGGLVDPRVLLLQAALFAAIHFVSIPHPARLAVFFPGLLFGLLRSWRGGIGAAMLLHALSNLLAELLEKGFHLT
ncbi:MAG: CPBP family intramembrane metalloprotease [Sandaracinaceae bacterium]|nr:CPBP family intramembrane metalloprotease [Sandaracinaceae bacterium]